MNYIVIPSLEHAALTRVVTALWNRYDIKRLIMQFYKREETGIKIYDEIRENWLKIEDSVIGIALQLPIPVPLKEKVLCFIKPIGIQILNWIECHTLYINVNTIPDEFHFTLQGTVDKKETAKVLIKDESLDIILRYKLACMYCLKGSILQLWNEIPEDQRKSFCKYLQDFYVFQSELVVFWTCNVKKDLDFVGRNREMLFNRLPLYQYEFEFVIMMGNRVAAEYFLQRLTTKQKNESMVRSANFIAARVGYSTEHYMEEDGADLLCFLMSQMNEEQRAELLKSYPYRVLECFLDWPRQNLFMKIANQIWKKEENEDDDTKNDYESVLIKIINKIIDKYKDFNYQKLFVEFWQQSFHSHKKHVLKRFAGDSLLPVLFKLRDKNFISLIFRDATRIERSQMFYTSCGQNFCMDLIENEEWDLIKYLIQEFISSEEQATRIKQEFEKCFDIEFEMCCSQQEFQRKKVKWDKFFYLVDHFKCGINENKYEEEKSSETKGF